MLPDLLNSLFSSVWTFFFAVVLLGVSIFVHELGHFLAARRRGVHVERFSIGFGPAIWSRRGRDGVEYRLSWIPLGGYVLLPQLADLGPIEGASEVDLEKLPPITYTSKMIVFVAGATFNVIFAFILASILWVIGLPESNLTATTKIGYVSQTLERTNGEKVPAPAFVAGLQVGDVLRAVDGHPVKDWNDIKLSLTLGDGRSANGDRQVILDLERDGHPMQLALKPEITGEDKERRIGISPGYELIVLDVEPGSLADKVGFKKNDEILRLDNVAIFNEATYREYLDASIARPVVAHIQRGGREGHELALTIPPTPGAKVGQRLGESFHLTTGFRMVHPTPFEILSEQARVTFRSLWSFISPHSDVGLDKASGVVGLIRVFQSAAEAGIRAVLIITVLVNVNLAIFNLLPIPVLDGGQMMFATIGRVRGRALPVNLVVVAQTVCFALLVSLILYVGFFDVRRWVRDVRIERAEATAPAKP